MQATKFAGRIASIVCRKGAAGRFGKVIGGTGTRASSDECPNSRVYEMTTYQSKPENHNEFMALVEKHWQTLTQYGIIVGSWKTQIGGLCETIHLFEYDSLCDRQIKRDKLKKDSKIANDFLPLFYKKNKCLTNYLLMPAPGTTVKKDFCARCPGVYELQRSEPYTPLINPECTGELVIGHFFTIYGPTASEWLLIRYEDTNKACDKAVERRKAQSLTGYSRFMIPNCWSALQ